MTNKNTTQNEKQQLTLTSIIYSWKSWILIFTLLMMVLFGILETALIKSPPSDQWSMAIEVIGDAPADFRKVGQVVRPNDEGIAMAYVVEDGIKLVELDWLGNVEKSSLIKMDSSKIRLVDIELNADSYQLYFSDRHVLDRLDIDIASLSVKGETRISESSEHFQADGRAVIVGDKNTTNILLDNKVVATLPSHGDLMEVNILADGDKIYATIDTFQGGSLVMVKDGKVIEQKLTNTIEQGRYGQLKDIHVSDGVVTVMSSFFSPSDPDNTALGIWQSDAETLESHPFKIFYHVRTSLEPQILEVDGDKISYVLGVQQTLDHGNKGIARYAHLKGGMFTNISKYTREGDIVIENTRLTVTHKYPLGYKYFETPKGDLLLWVDMLQRDRGQFLLAGKGEPWFTHANKAFKISYYEIFTSTVLTFGGTIFFGTFFLILYLGLQAKWIVGFIAIAFAYFKWAPLDPSKKRKHVFVASILFAISLKFYITAISNPDVDTYAHIYPMFLGNKPVLMITSLITSFFSLTMIKLWERQYKYIDSLFARFGVFIGFECFFFLYTVGVYILSGMMKNDFML